MQPSEASFEHQGRQSSFAEELDMTAVEMGIVVVVPSARQRYHQILQVSVVRRCAEKSAARFGGRETSCHERPWVIEVLHDLDTVDEVERRLVQDVE